MGDPAFRIVVAEHLKGRAPLEGSVPHKAVVLSVEVFHQTICEVQRELSRRSFREHGAHGLVVHPRFVMYFFVSLSAVLRRQVIDCRKEIRVVVPELLRHRVVGICDLLLPLLGDLLKEVIRELAASVRRVDRRQGSHMLSRGSLCDRCARIQTSFGVSDDIHFVSPCLLNDL